MKSKAGNLGSKQHRGESTRAPRVPVRIQGKLVLGSRSVPCEVHNISKHGAFLRTEVTLSVGEGLELHLFFDRLLSIGARVVPLELFNSESSAQDLRPFEGSQGAIVRWAKTTSKTERSQGQQESGIGIEFLGMDPDTELFLSRLISYFEALRRAGVTFESF